MQDVNDVHKMIASNAFRTQQFQNKSLIFSEYLIDWSTGKPKFIDFSWSNDLSASSKPLVETEISCEIQ